MSCFALETTLPTLPEHGSYWVAPTACVIGKVALSANSSIWFGAILRGDNEPIHIGEGSNVQDGSVLHTDPGYPLTIGKNCTIGHRAILHGCLIGDGSLVGMGTTVMNGAVIGECSLVGAGALVTEGKKFPARSLIMGVPARFVSQLDDAEVARLQLSASRYIENANRFRQGLRCL